MDINTISVLDALGIDYNTAEHDGLVAIRIAEQTLHVVA